MWKSLTNITAKNPRALVTGITGDWAFAAGTLLMQFSRYDKCFPTDIIIFSDGTIIESDAILLASLGARIVPISPLDFPITDNALKTFSALSLSKFACFDLLSQYESVVWLDADVIIQDSIKELFDMGPFGMAREDPAFSSIPGGTKADINIDVSIEDYSLTDINLNSGVIVFNSNIPEPSNLLNICINFIDKYGSILRYPDQAAFNYLAQYLKSGGHNYFCEIPQLFNCHPRNPQAGIANIVHAFGAYKLWNDGLTAVCFPEWLRDYKRWEKSGGSPYAGLIENSHFLEGSAFSMLNSLFETIEKSEKVIESLQKSLINEKVLREKLEKFLKLKS